jgi:hypothetical protein
VASASTPLAAAWQQLHRPADRLLSLGGTFGPVADPGSPAAAGGDTE